jgi:tetratricopeptide (TPR) repeat protein
MNYRIGRTILIGTCIGGMVLSAAFARPYGGFHGVAGPHSAPHPVGHYAPAGIPHGVPVHHRESHVGPAFHNPALYHSPGPHWNGYHQAYFGGRPLHLGWAGYRPSYYYHPWYHGPWGGHQWGWGWGFGPGIAFGIGGPGWGVTVGSGWGYGAPYRPYGMYGYWGRPMGWGFGGWGLGTIAYTSGYNPYYNPYFTGYAGGTVVYNYANPIPVAQSGSLASASPDADGPAPQPDNPAFDAARDEFRRGLYPAALTNVDRAIRAVPSDAVLHEFRALVLFAMGDYRQAAGVVHSVLAVGPGWDWTTMSSLYADPNRYAEELAALEAYTHAHPRAADAHFLLGYHYMIGSHTQEAAAELHTAVRLMPSDRLAGELLLMVKGPPKQPEPGVPGTSDGATVAASQADEPQLPPVDKEMLFGNWHAAREDGSKFRLTLSEDGNFQWKYSVPNQKGDEFSGKYTVDGPVLALERSEGGVMAGTATFDGDRRFNFRMVGGPPQDRGLDFSR